MRIPPKPCLFICCVTHIVAAAIVLPLVPTDAQAQQQARLKIRVVDEKGALLPARAWVDVQGKRMFQPQLPKTVTVYAKDRSFSCDGEFEMLVPRDRCSVHIERGKEYRPVDVEIDIAGEGDVFREVELKRWIDMPSRGWFSADLHVHLGFDDPRVLRQLALADDVHLVPSFTYWLRGRGETWHGEWPDASTVAPDRIDELHLVTRNNIEIERIDRTAMPGATVGATFLFNLRRPVTAEQYGEHFPSDAALCIAALSHSPEVLFDSDKPSWAETVVGAALGVLHTVQVCHNHYHRDATGLGGYGMIGPLEPNESNAAVGDGLFHRTNQLYYRFLNCGFRLGVSGGSAIGVKPMPTGHHRVYARIDGELTADKMWTALREGGSFATTGPMLDLRADNATIGDTLRRQSESGEPILVSATVETIQQLEALQIVQDGKVVATLDMTRIPVDGVVKETLEFEYKPNRSGWLAARALFRASDGLLRQAHTSPIYVRLDDKPIATADDARYMLRWLDVLDSFARSEPERFPSTEAQLRLLKIYEQARTRYQLVIEEARTHWQDP